MSRPLTCAADVIGLALLVLGIPAIALLADVMGWVP